MIAINYRDPRPIYEQIQAELRRLMLTGALPPGSRLPSVRELAGQLAINPNTIQRAYRELESEGYILSVAGKGSFVAQVDRLAEQQKKEALNAFRAAAQRLRALGLSAEALASLLTQEELTAAGRGLRACRLKRRGKDHRYSPYYRHFPAGFRQRDHRRSAGL